MMNSDTIKGDWKKMRGHVKEAFGKLTDDDLLVAEGNADQLTGAIQKRYGYTREKAAEEWTAFTERTSEEAMRADNNVRDAARDTGDTMRDAARNTADNVRDAARNTADNVRDAARNTADTVRGAAANGLEATSEAAAKAARGIDPGPNRDTRPERRDG